MEPRPTRSGAKLNPSTKKRPNPSDSQPNTRPQKRHQNSLQQQKLKFTPKTTRPKLTNSTPKPQPNLNPSTPSITLKSLTGDLFASPPTTLLLHACNCQGTWGAGIAKAFKRNYPAAFKIYQSFCAEQGAAALGKTLLIPPQQDSKDSGERVKGHRVGCLFTSVGKGRGKGTPKQILEATGAAVRDLVRQVDGMSGERDEQTEPNERSEPNGSKEGDEPDEQKACSADEAKPSNKSTINATFPKKPKPPHHPITGVVMCKINSGLFAVPWEDTKAVIEEVEIGEKSSVLRQIKVISPAEE